MASKVLRRIAFSSFWVTVCRVTNFVLSSGDSILMSPVRRALRWMW